MKKSKLFFLSTIITAAVFISGCGMDLTGSSYQIHTYVDEVTGVNYIWLNSDSGVTITPRYNADGSLYVK